MFARSSPEKHLRFESGTGAASRSGMQLPLQIVCRGFHCSESIDAKVRSKVDKLEELYGNITSCRVVIDSPHHHQHRDRYFV